MLTLITCGFWRFLAYEQGDEKPGEVISITLGFQYSLLFNFSNSFYPLYL